jgi:hypothetical protein
VLDCREGFITIFDCLALYVFNCAARRSCAVPHPAVRAPAAATAAGCLFDRFISVFRRFISLFGRLAKLSLSLAKHQSLGRLDAVLEGGKIEVFPVFSRRAGKGLPRPWRRS